MTYNKRNGVSKGKSTNRFNNRAKKTMAANKRPPAMRGGTRF